jgi:hypothetical protein
MRTLVLAVLFSLWTLASPVYAQLPCANCVEAEPLRTTYVTEHSFGPFATGNLEVTEGAFYALLADRWKTFSGSCASTFTPLGTWSDATGWQRNGGVGVGIGSR